MLKKELQSLESKSVLAAIFYLEKDEISSLEHEDIRRQLARNISRKNIVVFDLNNKQVNGEMEDDTNITLMFISQIKELKDKSIVTDNYFYNGIFYSDNQGDFVIITRESKVEFNDQINTLLQILIIVSLISLVFIYFFSHFLGYIAYTPINNIVKQIRNRNPKNFETPLVLKKSYAEIDDLIETYNQFIDQIGQTFSIQKNFIDYVSHELRTPITALLGTLEVTKQKTRSVEEYEETLTKLNQYTEDLQNSLDQMMILSGAKTNFETQKIRIDEVIWTVVEQAILYYQAKINVKLEVQNYALLNIVGNNKLLELALTNLLSNAIKYSDNQLVEVCVKECDGQLLIEIIDLGIGILNIDLESIKKNFYRGRNTVNYQGKGIGLSMANIILQLHQIELSIHPNSPKGSVAKLLFQNF